MPDQATRFNVQLDERYATKLRELAERTHVNPGTLAAAHPPSDPAQSSGTALWCQWRRLRMPAPDMKPDHILD